MSGFAWGCPAALLLLSLVPIMAAAMAYGERRRRRALAIFADSATRAALASELHSGRRRLKHALALAACAAAAFAVARPSWDARAPETPTGRDIVVLLDVSRSMLAQDLAPSRLEFARRGLAVFAGRLRGDRLALVAFAGTAAVRCPLTTDYEFFRLAVADTSPESVTLGGTELAGAIRTAVRDGFDDLSRRSRQLVLVSDAEDHGYAAAAAAADAARRGIRLSAVGIGDDTAGARVPDVTYRGREVWSKLDAGGIRRLAAAGGGGFRIVTPRSAADLGAELLHLVSASGPGRRPRTEAFPVLLALAAIALGAELAIGERRRA